MYPQYARFIPLEQRKTALYHLGYDHCDAHHLFCVLPRSEGEKYLRFCPLCAKEDRETYGEAYWHRKHQIRNMKICVRHKCKLVESDISAKSNQCFTFSPAENHIGNKEAVIEDNPLVIQFAEYLDSVFEATVNLENDVAISSVLYDGMSRTKYLKPSGRSRYTKMLADDMEEFYTNMGMHSIASIHQIQKVLLMDHNDFSVICQMAFFLGMKPEEVTAYSLSHEQIQREQESHYMKDNVPIDWDALDEETAPVLEAFARDVYDGTADKNGRPERVSEKLVYRELGLPRHRLENMPRCKVILEKYAESYPESWARKVIWAYQKLKEEGRPFYWTDIRKISGVKKKNFQVLVPYLRKRADAETVKQIIEMVTFCNFL